MLKLFRDNDQVSIFLISLFALFLWYVDWQAHPLSELTIEANTAPLGKWLLEILKPAPFIHIALIFILLILIPFLLVRMNTKFILTVRRTQLPASFFLFSVAGMTNITGLLLPLMAGLFYYISMEKMFSSYKKSGLASHFFDAAFLITTASFFYAPSFLFHIIVFYSLLELRAVHWREWMLAVMGVVAPLFIYHAGFFIITGSTDTFHLTNIDFFQGFYFPWNNLISYFIIALLTFLLMVSSIDIATGFQLKKIISRKLYKIFFWNFIVSLFLFFIIKNVESGILVFTSISLSFLFSHYFSLIRFTWFREIMFDLFFLIVIAKKIIPLLNF